MPKNRLRTILTTKSFSKTCKSGNVKASFLTETANFSIQKFELLLLVFVKNS